MLQYACFIVLLASLAGCSGSQPTNDTKKQGNSQKAATSNASSNATEISAEQLGLDFVKLDFDELKKKYFNKVYWVRGKVRLVSGRYAFVSTGTKSKEGQDVEIGMLFPSIPAAKAVPTAKEVVIEGRYIQVGISGPSFDRCKHIE